MVKEFRLPPVQDEKPVYLEGHAVDRGPKAYGHRLFNSDVMVGRDANGPIYKHIDPIPHVGLRGHPKERAADAHTLYPWPTSFVPLPGSLDWKPCNGDVRRFRSWAGLLIDPPNWAADVWRMTGLARRPWDLVPQYVWPGGTTLVYMDKGGDCLCAQCARQVGAYDSPTVAVYPHYEGSAVECDECGFKMESDYDPGEEEVR